MRLQLANLCRNCPLTAHALYKQRREACRPHKRLENAPLHSYIQICILEYHWSPEEIVGRIQLEHGCRLVSVPTIYRAIHAGLLNPPGASTKFVLRKLRHFLLRTIRGSAGPMKTPMGFYGLLQKYFPNDTPEDYIQWKYHELNFCPRKCLD